MNNNFNKDHWTCLVKFPLFEKYKHVFPIKIDNKYIYFGQTEDELYYCWLIVECHEDEKDRYCIHSILLNNTPVNGNAMILTPYVWSKKHEQCLKEFMGWHK